MIQCGECSWEGTEYEYVDHWAKTHHEQKGKTGIWCDSLVNHWCVRPFGHTGTCTDSMGVDRDEEDREMAAAKKDSFAGNCEELSGRITDFTTHSLEEYAKRIVEALYDDDAWLCSIPHGQYESYIARRKDDAIQRMMNAIQKASES